MIAIQASTDVSIRVLCFLEIDNLVESDESIDHRKDLFFVTPTARVF